MADIPNLVVIADVQTHPFRVPEGTEYGNQRFDNAVEVAQRKILIDVLGVAEYFNFVADYSGTGLVWNTQKWIDFVDGLSYTVSGVASTTITIPWGGIKEVLKYFSYTEWLNEIGDNYDKTGAQRSTFENAVAISKQPNFSKVQNLGVDNYGVDWACQFIRYNYLQYEYTSIIDKYYKVYAEPTNEVITDNLKLSNTAYNFLYYYNDRVTNTFPDWQFRVKTKSNVLGL
jgi:hypothetical protein